MTKILYPSPSSILSAAAFFRAESSINLTIMHVSTMLGFVSLAAALPAAVAPAKDSNLAVRDDSLVAARTAAAVEDSMTASVLAARADFERVVPWPTTAVTGGGPSFQYKAEPLSNGNFKITFYNSASLSGLSFKYTVYAGGGVLASETVPAGTTSKSVEVQRVGDSFRIVIQQT